MVELSGITEQPQIGQGGDSFNIAVYLSRISSSANVSYVTRLGDDPFSEQLVAFMQAEGIDVSAIARIPQRLPAIYAITLEQGERSFHYWREHAPVRELLQEPEPQVEQHLHNADCMVVTGITLAVLSDAGCQRLLAISASQPETVLAYVVNHRPILWSDRDEACRLHTQVLAQAKFAFISDEEQALLWPQVKDLSELSRHCSGELLKTVGAGGCEIWRAGSLVAKVGGDEVEVVDTTAAGDAFAARYIAGRLQGEEPAQAAQLSCQLAAEVVQHHGAIMPQESIPSACKLA